VASTIWDEAVKIAGADPDFQRRDLFEAIQRGDFPEWELGLQTFDQAFADSLPFDVLDPTKIIPEEVLPVRIVGGWCWTAGRTTSSPKPSRWPIARPTSCRASTSPMTRCCRVACFPTSTPRRAGWARPTSTRSRSTRPSAR
jgi:hypothetical protein